MGGRHEGNPLRHQLKTKNGVMMEFADDIKERIPKEIKYILLMFFSTRIVLTVIGVLSRMMLTPNYHAFSYSKNILLDVWGVWDTAWYVSIAEDWYSIPEMFGFFPLYPLLMRFFGFFVGDYYLAGLLVSNVSLLVACILLYKLVRLDGDRDTAFRSVKYLFLFPTAFVFSGVFTESLFLALLLACFYYARKGRWLLVGIFGFFLSLTKAFGMFMILPLAYEYLRAKNFRLKNCRLDSVPLLLIPCGLLVFSAYNYYLTGDYLAFIHIKEGRWFHKLSNPLTGLYNNLANENFSCSFNVILDIIAILLLSLFYRKIGFPYWLTGMIPLIGTLMTGPPCLNAISRYLLIIFPLYILFAKLSEKQDVDQLVTIFLALFQGFFMVFWTNAFMLTI